MRLLSIISVLALLAGCVKAPPNDVTKGWEYSFLEYEGHIHSRVGIADLDKQSFRLNYDADQQFQNLIAVQGAGGWELAGVLPQLEDGRIRTYWLMFKRPKAFERKEVIETYQKAGLSPPWK